MKDFWMYLLHPTFSYEANFPVSKERPSLTFLLSKAGLLFSLLFTIAIHYNDNWAPLNDAFRDGDAI